MKAFIQFKKTTPALLILLAVICLGLAPLVQAVGPDTEGSIAGSNNGEGVGVLVSRTTGIWNTGTGFEALNHLTAGNQNTATGVRALFNDTSGGYNTATGVYSLYTNTVGFFNSANGAYSLTNNTDGSQNTANGYSALYSNSTGDSNTAIGFAALYRNTEGINNTANGFQALFNNTTGSFNTATGYEALNQNTSGVLNNAFGFEALANNRGSFNNAFGGHALFDSTSGSFNNAFGESALFNNTGDANTAIGDSAGIALTTGDGNVCIGEGVGGEAGVSNSTYIRNVNTLAQPIVAGIDGVTVRLSDGRLGHGVSSRRYKEDIKPMDRASEALYDLKPITFRYKKEIDSTQTLDFGLIAEEVAEVNPELAVRDGEGKISNYRRDAINAMLLNEFLKEHREVQEQKATITRLKQDFESKIAEQQKQIEALTAGLQRVSAQVEVSRHARQTVVDNH